MEEGQTARHGGPVESEIVHLSLIDLLRILSTKINNLIKMVREKKDGERTEADAAAGGTHQVEDDPASHQLTKRQQRKLLQKSDKNAWPQHPRVQSPEARAKAYIRTAGLIKKTQGSTEESLQSSSMKWGRLLGGTDQRVRHKAVLQLQGFLKAKCDINNDVGGLSEQDLMKLWKALWYTLYMADKVPVQEELSKQIAHLIWCVSGTEEEDEYAGQAYLDMYSSEEGIDSMVCGVDMDDEKEEVDSSEDDGGREGAEETLEQDDSEIPHCRGAHLASLFVRTFFRTLRREWGKMDKYRLDKFYTLMRLMMHQVFRYMALRHWNLGIIRLFNDAMFEEVLSQTPNGLRFHLTDITLEELASVSASAPMPLTEATFLDCVNPFLALAQTGGGDDVVQARVVDQILVRFLEKYSVVCPSCEFGDNEDAMILDQVHVGTVAKFIFELASDGGTNDEYRKSLYDVHKMYARRLKEVDRDVDLGQDDEENPMGNDLGADDDEVATDISGQKDLLALLDHGNTENSSSATENVPKGRKGQQERGESSATGQETEVMTEASGGKKKRKKSKKKKSEENPTKTSDPHVTVVEEITISLADQNAARKALKSSADAVSNSDEGVKRRRVLQKSAVVDDMANKRVKFDNANRAKSWKASMKDLRRMESPVQANLTPEKGILLNKDAKPKIRTGRRRKRL